jgi:hypothetical protein
MRPVVIVTPDYTHTSNGIRALHDLCHHINMMGGTARLLLACEDAIKSCEPAQTNPDWNTPGLQDDEAHFLQDGIVIYPETIHGNPLQATRVVRWMGNKDGALREKRGMGAAPTDFIVAHSKVIRPDADFVLYYSYVNPCFNDIDASPEKRVMNATYIGKGYLYKNPIGIIKNTLWIERKWTSTQEQLAFLLKHIACVYTWDCWSQTNVDAILCGAVPFFLQYDPFTSDEIDSAELGRIPRLDGDHRSFDLEQFKRERFALMARIGTLQATWPVRVREFYDKMQARFQ